MATGGSSVATVWAQVKISTDGITRDLQQAMAPAFRNLQQDMAASLSRGMAGVNTGNLSGQVSQSLQSGVSSANLGQGISQQVNTGTAGGARSGMLSGLKKAGPAIAGIVAGLGIGAAVGKSIGLSLDKNEGLAKASAGLALNKNQTSNLEAASLNVFKKGYGENVGDMQSQLSSIMSSSEEMKNMSVKDLTDVGEKMASMTDIFEFSSDEIAQSAGNLVKYGMADDMGQAMDLLFSSISKAPKQAQEEILAATNEYTKSYAQIGLSGEQMMESLIKGSEDGVIGVDKTGDSIKEFSIIMAEMPKGATEAMKGIGFSGKKIKELQQSLLQGGEGGKLAFKTIAESLIKIKDPAQKAAASVSIFGTMAEDLGAQNLDGFLGSMIKGEKGIDSMTKSVATSMDTYTNSAAAKVASLKNTMTATMMVMGDEVLKGMTPALGELTTFLDKEGGTLAKQFGETVGTVVSELLPQIMEISKVSLPIIAEVIGGIAEFLKFIQPAIPVIMPIIMIAGAIAAILVPIQGVIAAVQFLIPIFAAIAGAISLPVLAIAAIGAAVVLLISLIVINWDSIAAFLSDTWNNITSGVSSWFGSIGDDWNALWGNMKAAGNNFGSWLGDIWGTTKEVTNLTVGGIASDWGGLWDYLGGGLNNFGGNWTSFWDNAGVKMGGVTNSLGGLWDNMWTVVGGGLTRIGDTVWGVFKNVGNFVVSIINSLVGALNYVIDGMNKLSFEVPSWVPEIGGNKWGINLAHLGMIPAFATGADIMGSTVGLIGENKPERIIDRGLGNANLEKQNALIDDIRAEGIGGRGKNITNHISINEVSQDPRVLANQVIEEIDYRQGW